MADGGGASIWDIWHGDTSTEMFHSAECLKRFQDDEEKYKILFHAS